jgi:hypothetical protein
MNSWEMRKTAIVEADDWQDRYDRNGMNFLFYWKAKFPKFKITLFTIPDRTSKEMIQLILKHYDWIELAVHGFNHESNFECYSWDYDRTQALMDRIYRMNEPFLDTYKRIFKAPGWTITGGYNGYPPDENSPIAKDPQGVYRALTDMNYIIVDRHYNKPARPENANIICIDDQPDIVHMHTWDMETGDKAGRNGFRQVEEEQGVPWDRDTEFFFISEAWEKGMIKPCV